jgi:hypothetical protein
LLCLDNYAANNLPQRLMQILKLNNSATAYLV